MPPFLTSLKIPIRRQERNCRVAIDAEHDRVDLIVNLKTADAPATKGAWRDNVFVERQWRSVKYEEVYLRAYDTASEARASIGRYLDFYNCRRPHSSLDGSTPDHAYFTPPPNRMAA
jgi:putative transposase